MRRKSAGLKVLMVAAATPNLATNALAASETNAEIPAPYGIAGDARPVVLAQRNPVIQKNQTITADQARQAVRAELARMSPEQKAQLGRSQVQIEDLAVQPASITKCGGNITNGIGCTDPGSGGFVCCLVTLGPPAG